MTTMSPAPLHHASSSMVSATADASSASSPPPLQQQPREIAPFLKSMRAMLDSESSAVICWTQDGHAFEIRDVQKLTNEVLPKYFKHAKYASFQRQLNYFNFRKWTKSKTEVCTFSNPHFQRDAPLLSWRILRKRSLSDLSAATAANGGAGSSAKRQRTPSSTPLSTPTTVDATLAYPQWPLDVEPAAVSSSVSSGSGSDVDIERDVETALHWIDALFPSLESLTSLGSDASSSTGSSVPSTKAKGRARRSAAQRRTTPMPPQSFEYVSW